jgi:hypothetical protein
MIITDCYSASNLFVFRIIANNSSKIHSATGKNYQLVVNEKSVNYLLWMKATRILQAIKHSRILSGTAHHNIANGSTERLPTTNHMRTKAPNHAVKVDSQRLNRRSSKKHKIARPNDQRPHTTPLVGSSGKSNPMEL